MGWAWGQKQPNENENCNFQIPERTDVDASRRENHDDRRSMKAPITIVIFENTHQTQAHTTAR